MKFYLKKHILVCILIFALVLLLDQLTKHYFLTAQPVHDYGWISLHLVRNTGASFGMLKQFSIALTVLSAAVLIGLAAYFPKAKRQEQLALALVAAGITGNLLNRLMYGYVIDFIDLKWWPVFNVADSVIFIGVVGFGILLMRKK